MPSASTPSAESVIAATSGVVPRKVRPSSAKVIVQKMGRSEFSLAASTAALASARSAMVSMMKRSAPAASAARTCSAKSSYASSKLQVPSGASSWPVGPRSAATYGAPLALAHAIAAEKTRSTVAASPSLAALAPKVLVVTTSAPAST